MATRPLVGACANCASSASTVGASSASSTHFQIRPQSAACCAESLSPSSVSPMRPRRADQPGQEIRSARIGDEADLAERLDETRRFCRDHEIARQRDVRACAGGNAVDRAHHGHRQRPQRQHQRAIVGLDRRAQVHRRGSRRDGAIGEVLSRAEAAPRAGQQQHARPNRRREPWPARRAIPRASPR